MIVLDTGVLLAVADADDRWHVRSLAVLDRYRSDQLLLPAPVIPETGWPAAAGARATSSKAGRMWLRQGRRY